MRKRYPSDISKEQFELILPDLESARKKTKPRKIVKCKLKSDHLRSLKLYHYC